MESPERNKISFGAITNRQAESILDILLARLITFNLFFFADFPKAIKNITLFPGARGEKKSAAMSVPGFDTSIFGISTTESLVNQGVELSSISFH